MHRSQVLLHNSRKLYVLMISSMDPSLRRLAIIALLTALVLPLGDLWMSYTSYSYAKLHLFIVAPVTFLYLIPPRPLSHVSPRLRQISYFIMAVLALVAVVYSVTGWDRILYKTGVITCSMSYGSLLYVPYEEWVWCVDHTILVALWVMSIWPSRPVPQTRQKCPIFRLAMAAVFLVLTYLGYVLQTYEQNYFYIGLTLLHTCPILALHFATVGHIFFEYPCEYFLGFVVPSLYVLVVDTYAISKGIWGVREEFTTGHYVFGVRLEHAVVYTLTTVLASQTMIGFMRSAEIYLALTKGSKRSTIKSVIGGIVDVWR